MSKALSISLIACAVLICVPGVGRAKAPARDLKRINRVLDRIAPQHRSTISRGVSSRLKHYHGVKIWRFSEPSSGFHEAELTYPGKKGMTMKRSIVVRPGAKDQPVAIRSVSYSWPDKTRLTFFYKREASKVRSTSVYLEPRGSWSQLKRISVAEAKKFLKDKGPFVRKPKGLVRRLAYDFKQTLKGAGSWAHRSALLLNQALQD